MTGVAMSFLDVGMSYGSKGFLHTRSKSVLQGVSFDIYKGETLGVIGKNGAGKSTLMKLVAGILKPDCGVINSFVDRVQLLSLQLGFINELTGRENVILSSLLLGMGRAEIERKFEEIVAFSGLENAIDDPLRTYSSGMRARLGFAISSQADPDILVIDEAFGVGDNAFREKSRAVITERMKSDRSFLLVSHSEGMLKEYCQRLMWIESGRLKMIGETDSVIEAYRNN